MWRWIVLGLAPACSYRAPATALDPDASPPGGDATSDTPSDAADAPPMVTTCQVGAASTTGTDRGRVGGDGGGDNFAPLTCDTADQRIVGIALRMSDQDTVFGGRSAHAFLIACATVTVDSTGAAVVGGLTMEEITGNGNFDWTPSTLTPVTQCQPGWIVSGLAAHTGSGDNRWLDATLTCSQLDATGAVIATETLTVTGSLTEAVGAEQRQCNAGEILVRLPNRSGAGIDSVNLACSTPVCS